MTIITNNDDDDDDNNTNINDYSVILLKVYFLCFVATELFFPLSPFLKKKRILQGFLWSTLEPFLLTYPCWCWWTVPILFACSPCIAMSLLSLNYSICIDFLFVWFFWTNHFLVARLRPRCRRGRGCARLYRFMRFLLVFWELYSNTFQVCIEKHSSHLSHVDLERCISAFSVWNSKKKRKKTCKNIFTTVDFDSLSLLF